LKNLIRKTSYLALVTAQVLCTPVMASIPGSNHNYKKINLGLVSTVNNASIDMSKVEPVESLTIINQADIAKMIPVEKMQASNDTGAVASQILDRSLSSFFDSDAVRHSDMGKTAHQVEDSMQTNVNFGSGEIKHSFKFKVEASQTRAQMDYSGLTNAQVSYQAAQRQFNVEMYENLSARSKIVFDHTDLPNDTREVVSLRWTW
jgi:hypothetical protein